ncbi:MAG TPA: DNA polymerase III subunit gamma/tau [Thermoanaerobaculia bacterium]|nr:DNA polymerase III subunit gamma/tau [Thermoanaerobaculia bacterium]
MSYQVLARKWRPQDFSALVGQEAIVTALRNGLADGRIAHAYLFSGIRGVGKTTTARLLAKALNCEKGALGDPCNECVICQEITRGNDLDVLEIDAATYSKVEQVRDLTESLRYPPVRDRNKVVVIDEVHRLSRQAFDALLKIVEEPPPHLVFVFATTEIEAVPATILSRCQEYRFRRVSLGEMAAYLRRVADAEAITASDAALRLIARAGEGSVRDSVALLDQLATFGAGTIRDEDAARLSGSLDSGFFLGLLAAILGGDALAVVNATRRLDEEGWDPRHVFAQFLGLCRDALHLAVGGRAEGLDLPADDAAALAAVAGEAGYENLLRLMHLLLRSEDTVRRSDAALLAAEIAWLRAAELPKLVQVEELLAGVDRAPAARPTASPPHPAPAPVPRPTPGAAVPQPAPASAPAAPRSEPPRRTEPTAAPAATASVARLLEEVSRRRQALAAHLGSASRLEIDNGELLIYLPPTGSEMLARALERDANRQVLDEALAEVAGPGLRWRTVAAAASTPAPAARTEAPPPAERAATEHPTVQAVLDIFGGTVATVEPSRREEEE